MLRHSLLLAATAAVPLAAQAPRPMTFLDVQNMRQANGQDLSPDGRQMLYTLSTPDWQNARRQSDIYLVSTRSRPREHATADIHEGQERDEREVVARRIVRRLPVRSRRDRRCGCRSGGRGRRTRRRRRRRRSQPALRVASRRRRSQARDGRARRRLAISSSQKTARSIVYTTRPRRRRSDLHDQRR